jgi:hypothetical protein
MCRHCGCCCDGAVFGMVVAPLMVGVCASVVGLLYAWFVS